MKKRSLGEILLEMGAIDEMQLQAALAHHRQWGVPLGQALVEKRLCGHDSVFKALARQSGLPVVDLQKQPLSSQLSSLLPMKVAEKHRCVPLRLEGKRNETLVVAIAAPASLSALDAVQSVTGKQRIIAHLATDDDISLGLHRIYGLELKSRSTTPPAFAPARVENEVVFEIERPQPLQRKDGPTVHLYGWPSTPKSTLTTLLSDAGFNVEEISEADLAKVKTLDVVLSPLPSIDAAAKRGIKLQGRLVVAGKDPDTDYPRAQELGACGFIPAPLDTDFLMHVLRRVAKKAAA